MSEKAATTFTMNSPESLLRLHALVSRLYPSESVYAAELIREIGVKCIGFNGVSKSRQMVWMVMLIPPDPSQHQLPQCVLRWPSIASENAVDNNPYSVRQRPSLPFAY